MRTALGVLMAIGGMGKAETDPASGATGLPVRVFGASFASSLDADGGRVSFARASEASFFDIRTNRIVTVPADQPRFVGAADKGKPWGFPAGVFLEGPTRNLLLDSSFEGALTNWTFEGRIAREADVRVHGDHGLTVEGPATLTHQPVQVRIFPERCTYLLSLYVRRADGSDMSPHDVVCDGRPIRGPWDARQNSMLPVAKLGAGPWHRVSAIIGNWVSQQRSTPLETNAFVHSFRFRKGSYHVDAAQLEWNPSTPNRYWVYFGPSSYVPTLETPAERAQDSWVRRRPTCCRALHGACRSGVMRWLRAATRTDRSSDCGTDLPLRRSRC